MIREVWWWVDEHRGRAALIVAGSLAVVALAAWMLGSGGEGASGHPVAVPKRGEALGPNPEIAAELSRELRARSAKETEAAGRAGGEARGEKRARACARPELVGEVVEVTSRGLSCAELGEIVSAFRTGPRPQAEIGGFRCEAEDEGALALTCLAPEGESARLLFGPGGPGLSDCGRSPAPDGSLISLRASGIACNPARMIAFAQLDSDGEGGLRGYSCRAGEADVVCSKGRTEIAFTAPG